MYFLSSWRAPLSSLLFSSLLYWWWDCFWGDKLSEEDDLSLWYFFFLSFSFERLRSFSLLCSLSSFVCFPLLRLAGLSLSDSLSEFFFSFLLGFSSSELPDFLLRLVFLSSFSSFWNFLLLSGLFFDENSWVSSPLSFPFLFLNFLLSDSNSDSDKLEKIWKRETPEMLNQEYLFCGLKTTVSATCLAPIWCCKLCWTARGCTQLVEYSLCKPHCRAIAQQKYLWESLCHFQHGSVPSGHW